MKNESKLRFLKTVLVALFCIGFPMCSAWAVTFPIPSLELNVETASSPEEVAVVLEIIALLTILALAPAILILMTPITRLVVVFHFLRQAMGTQSSPPESGHYRSGLVHDIFHH